jgi:hypothetical protein
MHECLLRWAALQHRDRSSKGGSGPEAVQPMLLNSALFADIFGNEAIRADAAIPAFGLDRLRPLAELALYNFN